MAYLFFQCSSCLNNLAVDSDYEGEVIECPGCQQKMLVPEARCKFRCTKCNTELHAPAGMAGSEVDCPECETTAKVPPPVKEKPRLHLKNQVPESPSSSPSQDNPYSGKKITCPKCNSFITFSEAQIEQSMREFTPYACPKCGEGVVFPGSPPPRLCPYCGGRVTSEAIVCVNCGTNLKTGTRQTISNQDGEETDVFAIIAFSTGLLSIWVLPIVLAPICYISAMISYYRIKENPSLKGGGIRIVGGLLGCLSLIWVFNGFGLRDSVESYIGMGGTTSAVQISNNEQSGYPSQSPEPVRSSAYAVGYEEGTWRGGQDRNNGSYDNLVLAPDKKTWLVTRRGFTYPSRESGDFFEGYDAGYQSAR